ncbi:MAG TPA: hypothetical protein VKP14_09455 [Gaiellaceae bacterium]|nr:hypothetical protein [Gaiellaceae bacterium]
MDLAVDRLASTVPFLRRLAGRLEQVRPVYALAAFVLAEWLATLALALTARHNGWLYYQGGDQTWFYTTSWLLRHGQLPPTVVGYGWSTLLMPFTLVGGPNLLQVLPAVVLLNVLVLMPVAMVAMYGIGERIGGRLFGYWVVLLWIVVPFIGIKYTDAGFHQRYTEATLPQGLGLTAMSDFPSMVMLVVAAYFLLRALQRPVRSDALLAGLFAGFAIGIKPSNSLILVGVGLAVVAGRHWRAGAAFAAGVAPGLLVLALWKWRGLGYLPLFHAEHGLRLAAGAIQAPLGTFDPHKYIHLDWSHFGKNLDSLQEHFWSARVIEWLVVAGVIALARRSIVAALLVGGWFFVFVVAKATGPNGNLEDASLLRMLIPAIPAFVLLLAALPLLLPRSVCRLPRVAPPRPWGTPRIRLTLAVAASLLFVAVPAALAGAAHPLLGSFSPSSRSVFWLPASPVPLDPGLHFSARRVRGGVRVAWKAQHLPGGHVVYQLLRLRLPTLGCPPPHAALSCYPPIVPLVSTSFFDNVDPPDFGRWEYRVLVTASWTGKVTDADPYVASPAIALNVR